MATFQDIRGFIEKRVQDAFAPTPVLFDNVQETPPDAPYVMCIISWPSTTEAVICQTESMVENIRGNLQISCYNKRGIGMKPLEEMGATAMVVMNTLFDWESGTRIKCGQISGPIPVLSGDSPNALITVSCPFTARADGITRTDRLYTRDVVLTRPQRSSSENPTSAEVYLTRPVAGVKTQEDANEVFDQRLRDLEDNHDSKQGHDSGTY